MFIKYLNSKILEATNETLLLMLSVVAHVGSGQRSEAMTWSIIECFKLKGNLVYCKLEAYFRMLCV